MPHGLDELTHESRLVVGGERRLHQGNRLPDRFLHDLGTNGTLRRLGFLVGDQARVGPDALGGFAPLGQEGRASLLGGREEVGLETRLLRGQLRQVVLDLGAEPGGLFTRARTDFQLINDFAQIRLA